MALALAELRLSAASAGLMAALGLVAFSILVATWIALGWLICLFLLALGLSLVASVAICLGLCLLVLVVLGTVMARLAGNLGFPATSRQMASYYESSDQPTPTQNSPAFEPAPSDGDQSVASDPRYSTHSTP